MGGCGWREEEGRKGSMLLLHGHGGAGAGGAPPRCCPRPPPRRDRGTRRFLPPTPQKRGGAGEQRVRGAVGKTGGNEEKEGRRGAARTQLRGVEGGREGGWGGAVDLQSAPVPKGPSNTSHGHVYVA